MSRKVPDGWTECKLRDIADIKMGQSPKSESYNNSGEGLPFLQGSRTFGSRYPLIDTYCTDPKIIANEGEILFSVRAPVGDINIADKKICIGRGLASLNAKNQQNLFLFYLLHFIKDDIINLESGTVFGSVNKKDLESVPILLPTLPEQRAIASIFPPIEDKIELLRQENETLEAMAETIFKQWFIKDPENKEVLLKDIYVFEKGFEPGSSNYLETEEDNTIRFIRLKDMDNKNSSIFIKKSLAKNICVPDDLLVAFDGSPGKIGFGIEGAFSSGIRKVYSIHETYNNVWLKYLIFKSKPIQNTIKTYSTGTIIQHAGSCIDKLTFKFPEESKIKEFNELITPIFIKIQQNKQQLQTLSQLFDTLLHGLMSGELRVDDALCQS